MSTTLPQVNPQQQAANHFSEIQKLFPQMPEPHRGVITHALNVCSNPAIDAECCKAAGKVVHIIVKMATRVEQPVFLRGGLNTILSWDSNRAAIPQGTTPDFYSREFVFHVPPAQMNEKFEIKFFSPLGSSLPDRWSLGNNIPVDLSTYGHIAVIEVTNVTFV